MTGKWDNNLTNPYEMGLGEISKKDFEKIYDRHANVLFHIISITVKNQKYSEDLLIKCFIEIWEERIYYDPLKESLLSWMVKKAKKNALEFINDAYNQGYGMPLPKARTTETDPSVSIRYS